MVPRYDETEIVNLTTVYLKYFGRNAYNIIYYYV